MVFPFLIRVFLSHLSLSVVHVAAQRFARDVIHPLVRKMDEECKFDSDMLKGIFENGVSSRDPFPCSELSARFKKISWYVLAVG